MGDQHHHQIWAEMNEEAMEAYMVFIRSLLEYVPEAVTGDSTRGVAIFSGFCISGRICERIAFWLSARDAYDPYVIYECTQVLSDIFFTILDENVPKSLREGLSLHLNNGHTSSLLIQTLIKCVFSSFPYELIPDICRLLFLICELDSVDYTTKNIQLLQSILCDAVRNLPEVHFSQFELQKLIDETSDIFIMSNSSKRTNRLTAYLRSIYKSCRRRLDDADDNDTDEHSEQNRNKY